MIEWRFFSCMSFMVLILMIFISSVNYNVVSAFIITTAKTKTTLFHGVSKRLLSVNQTTQCYMVKTTKLTTLTDETTWNLRLLLNSAPTENGKSVNGIFSIQVQFIEEVGYEPPEGNLKQV